MHHPLHCPVWLNAHNDQANYQGHQCHLTEYVLNEEFTVLYYGIMPQWTDLTYIGANGNFWIWLIRW